jgi:hypothetical protein
LTEELDCCDAFQEPGIDDTTTFEPISLVAGKRYYIEFRYKKAAVVTGVKLHGARKVMILQPAH